MSDSELQAVNGQPQFKDETRSAPASPPPQPPNGGTVAWLFVVAAFLLFVITWGPSAGAGAFQDYYQRELLAQYTPSAISWIGTVNATFLISTGVLAGPLFDRGYVRHLMLLGSFMVVFGQMMLSLSTKYYQVMLSQGFCIGIGAGLIYVPAIAMVNTQFTTRRAIAMGLVTSGASGVLFPIIFIRLQPRVGFPWTIRVLAFIQLACCLVALPLLFLGKAPPRPKNPRSIIHWEALKEYTFSAYAVANFLLFMGYFIPIFYVPFFAIQALGTSLELGFGLLAVLNGASAFGRIGSSLMSRKLGASRLLVSAVAISSVMLFGWIGVHNLAGFVVFCIFFGLFSGVLISANPVVVAHPVISPTPSVIGTRLGMQWFATSLGVLVGAPIAGALGADGSMGAFHKLQGFAGAAMAGGVLFLLVPLTAVWKYDKNQ
ncbi:hypothetical protein B7494_g1762 [Chlorociboria aeruginascens]|nr:hypothetical protein B7494_g1762 [Chlorociboria aeruginascens]